MSAIHLLDDDQLTGLLRTGNELAFTEIYNRYWDKLYYIAHKLLKDTDAAEEIVQDVFFILWKKRETLTIKSLPAYRPLWPAILSIVRCPKKKTQKNKKTSLAG
ncbi:sigma factor [Mucilaginibacter humi]|uniref:sigma factor n=1 Tax=Mucilaginibacter humi TaxID=2732510 RepID=UPI00293B972B|nr:sigma factor [Mucilaginibacter humi]